MNVAEFARERSGLIYAPHLNDANWQLTKAIDDATRSVVGGNVSHQFELSPKKELLPFIDVYTQSYDEHAEESLGAQVPLFLFIASMMNTPLHITVLRYVPCPEFMWFSPLAQEMFINVFYDAPGRIASRIEPLSFQFDVYNDRDGVQAADLDTMTGMMIKTELKARGPAVLKGHDTTGLSFLREHLAIATRVRPDETIAERLVRTGFIRKDALFAGLTEAHPDNAKKIINSAVVRIEALAEAFGT